MDHEEAIQAQASMRYVLGDLTPAERDAFEEHFADCSNCMNEVGMATAFKANAREVFRDRAARGTPAKGAAWLRWRPFPVLAFSAALNLVFLVGLGYGLLRLRPAMRPEVAELIEPQSIEVVPVHGTTRGSSEPVQTVRASGRTLVLTFDLPQGYEHYYYSIDRTGTKVLSGEVTATGRPDTLNLQIPVARLHPGEYRVVLTGASGVTREELGACVLQVSTR